MGWILTGAAALAAAPFAALFVAFALSDNSESGMEPSPRLRLVDPTSAMPEVRVHPDRDLRAG